MLAMQYSISLPADYDMNSIRDRVAKRGPTYDRHEHLGFKAFLITEKGKGGNQEHSYAPFYVWQAEQGHARFLVRRQVQRTDRVLWLAARESVDRY